MLPREFGAFVRAILAAEDPRVEETTYAGRAAWRLDVDAVPNAIVPDLSGDRFSVTVDRETGLPVVVVERKGGAVLREIRIERLAVDAELPRETFTLDFPAGMEVMRSDDGFRRAPLDEVATLVPGWVPPGFELAEVASAPGAGVVSLSYRRGFDELVATTRPVEASDGRDPLAPAVGFAEPGERIVLARGALAGREAELVIAPRAIPHLWSRAGGLVVTVAGDADRGELVRVAESLRRP